MDREFSTSLRAAAQLDGSHGSDALDWRGLLKDAADEIDALHARVDLSGDALVNYVEPPAALRVHSA